MDKDKADIEEAKGHTLRWQKTHRDIKAAYRMLIKKWGRAPSVYEVAVRARIAVATVHRHTSALKFEPLEHPLRILTDDVLLAVAQGAINGNAGSQKLWFQIVEGMGFDGMLQGSARTVGDVEEERMVAAISDKVELAKILATRVAMRKGIEASSVIQGMEGNWYKKQGGDKVEDVEFVEVDPTKEDYDWDAIKGKMEKAAADDELKYRKDIDVVSGDIKKRLMERVKEMKKNKSTKGNAKPEVRPRKRAKKVVSGKRIANRKVIKEMLKNGSKGK